MASRIFAPNEFENSQKDFEASKFRKKPVVIEAFQITKELAMDHWENDKPLPFGLSRLSGSWHPIDKEVHNASISIETLEGRMIAELGDWIIKGVKGELYPCKPDIFEATYEAIDEAG
jgi:hypothetical protein